MYYNGAPYHVIVGGNNGEYIEILKPLTTEKCYKLSHNDYQAKNSFFTDTMYVILYLKKYLTTK